MKVSEHIEITTCYNFNHAPHTRLHIPANIVKEHQLKEIVFDKRGLTIREASIDDRKTYNLSKSHNICFGLSEEINGKYDIEKDGDCLLLNKIN